MPAHSIRPRVAVLAAGIDLALVLAFVLIGRRNHEEGLALPGVLGTLWPFLVGLAIGWLASRAWRRPLHPWRVGVPVWVCTVALGILFRVLSGQGIAASFVLVTMVLLAVALVGWRFAANLLPAVRSSPTYSIRPPRTSAEP